MLVAANAVWNLGVSLGFRAMRLLISPGLSRKCLPPATGIKRSDRVKSVSRPGDSRDFADDSQKLGIPPNFTIARKGRLYHRLYHGEGRV